jgi:hypothetical protein
MPERRDHRQTHKNSDAKHDNHVAPESARIFDYLLDFAHKSTGVTTKAVSAAPDSSTILANQITRH